MSVLTRKSIENNLVAIQKQLSDVGGGDTELKSLESRLTTEKDAFVKALIAEKVERLKKSKKEPSQYQQYATELKHVQTHLTAALGVMETIPFYVTSTKGKTAKGVTRKK